MMGLPRSARGRTTAGSHRLSRMSDYPASPKRPAQLSEAALAELARVLRAVGRVSVVSRLAGGYGNENLLIRTGDGQQYVLRRQLRGDPAVETALLRHLQGRAPTPELVYADPAGDLLGEPISISRFVRGAMAARVLGQISTPEVEQIARAIGGALGALARETFARPGFFVDDTLQPQQPDGDLTTDLTAFVTDRFRSAGARAALSPTERSTFLRIIADAAPLLQAVADDRNLVHGDFNAKNVLVDRASGIWRVTAVLDWEFSFAGSQLVDVGNMLRFPDELQPAFPDSFARGFLEAGGRLDAGWKSTSRLLDVFSLADFLKRPANHPFFGKAVGLIRQIAHRGYV